METIIFDDKSTHWRTENNDYNLKTVQLVGNYCKDLLNSRGYIYLNQIYELFGVDWDPDMINNLYLSRDGQITFEFEPVENGNILIRIS